LPVRRIAAVEEAVAHVVEMAGRGGAVAWIRNAVDDAIEAVEILQKRGLELIVLCTAAPICLSRASGQLVAALHARFAMGDCLDIEHRVSERLGKDGTAIDRHGLVLVGTQIL
jgi:CRISPR-associated endonuclease/helicase Cas3